MSCSNSGFVGYPILLLILTPIAGVVLALNMMVENLVIPLLFVMAERTRGGGGVSLLVIFHLERLVMGPESSAFLGLNFC